MKKNNLMDFSERIAHGYFFAKQYVINKGFGNELDWQEQLNFEIVTEQKFLSEISWVILASGMNDKVIRKIFPQIKSAMLDFKSADLICKRKTSCYNKALRIFNHKGKINAIIYAAEYLKDNSLTIIKSKILNDGIKFIQTFPYMGKATAFHFAKNLGLNYAKPDRHLNRISSALGFSSPKDLCREISNVIDEKVSLIDLVLWRYATLDKNYIKRINWFVGNYPMHDN
jgi:hypothetical protein